jgi:hypothetical protein
VVAALLANQPGVLSSSQRSFGIHFTYANEPEQLCASRCDQHVVPAENRGISGNLIAAILANNSRRQSIDAWQFASYGIALKEPLPLPLLENMIVNVTQKQTRQAVLSFPHRSTFKLNADAQMLMSWLAFSR